MLRVLVACEFRATVAGAFHRAGHEVMSCDFLATERPEIPHYQGDVRDILDDGWDLMIAHPTCRYLSNSGVRWLYSDPERWKEMISGACFFRELLEADIPRKCIENPVIHRYAKQIIGRSYTQSFQPNQFGHGESKRVCLWLEGLPQLKPTKVVPITSQRVWRMPPGPNRESERSRFFDGVADAMASQWGGEAQREAA